MNPGEHPQRRALFEYAFGAGLATLVAGGASLAQAAPGAGGQQAATATVPGISLAKGVRRIITGCIEYLGQRRTTQTVLAITQVN